MNECTRGMTIENKMRMCKRHEGWTLKVVNNEINSNREAKKNIPLKNKNRYVRGTRGIA